MKQMLSRKASFNLHGEDSSYFQGWKEYEKNSYHEIHNPSGIIQMGLAENQLSFDLLESWLAKNTNVTHFKEDRGGSSSSSSSSSLFKELALFQDYHGLPAFKKELVELMGEIRGNTVRYDPNKLVLTAGATAANETLMFCLAEPGEAFLIPTPYYPGFDRDVKWRTEVELVPIHCSSSNHFRLTKLALEEAYQRAQKRKLKVKGVLITNPSNPLGTTMGKDELNHLLDFAISKKIHIVSDEIYSGTVFDSPGFISITQALLNHKKVHVDNDISNRIHIVYSLSKDLGLPGFRVGMIYSENEAIISAATKMSSFGLVSSQTQFLLSHILGEKNFRKFYMKENQKRLKTRHGMMVSGLENAGISCLKSNAGLFCWVDMRHLLSSNTFEAEKELWEKIIFEVKLNISPGSSCHCIEPGWFRICFANMSTETLNVAMQRIKTFADAICKVDQINYQQALCSSKKSSLNKWLLHQLSLWRNHGDHESKYR